MQKLFYLSVFAVFIFIFSSFILPDAHATGGTISDGPSCKAVGGTWNGINTCTVTSLTINFGETLNIGTGIVLVNQGIINLNSSTLVINSGGTFINNGYINSSGNINNFGTITNNSGRTINMAGSSGGPGNFSFGSLTNNSGGIINNSGFIFNVDSITNLKGGIIHNSGGTILCTFGCISDNSGTIDNSGSIDIYTSFPIKNSGMITNNLGGIIDITASTITNSGTINNSGNITNSFGMINNSHDITNQCSGIITSGDIFNLGTIRNGGTINISGALTGSAIMNFNCHNIPSSVIPQQDLQTQSFPTPSPRTPSSLPTPAFPPEDDHCFKNGQLICEIHLEMLKEVAQCYYINDAPCVINCPSCPPVMPKEMLTEIQQEFPPLQQIKAGWKVQDVVANTGKVLLKNDFSDYPISVTPETAKMLLNTINGNWNLFP